MSRTPPEPVHTCMILPAHQCPGCEREAYNWETTPEEDFWDDRTTPLAYSQEDSEQDMAARRVAPVLGSN